MSGIARIGLENSISSWGVFLNIVWAIGMASPQKFFVSHTVQLVFIDNTDEALHKVELHISLKLGKMEDNIAP